MKRKWSSEVFDFAQPTASEASDSDLQIPSNTQDEDGQAGPDGQDSVGQGTHTEQQDGWPDASDPQTAGGQPPSTAWDAPVADPQNLHDAGPPNSKRNINWSTIRDPDDGRLYTIEDGVNKREPIFEELELAAVIELAREGVANEPYQTPDYTYVRKRSHVMKMVTILEQLPTDHPWISFDLEASDLGHKSPLALMQIRDHYNSVTYLVDTLVLEESDTWDTPSLRNETTLRHIFEDPNRTKLVWDCRQDSCCLFGQFQIRLQGVLDVQYLHLLMMDTAPPYRRGLREGVKDMAGLTYAAHQLFLQSKNGIQGHGWMKRPIGDKEKKYAAGDVSYLRDMYLRAERWLTPRGMQIARGSSMQEISRTWVDAEYWAPSGPGTMDGFGHYWYAKDTYPIRRPGAVSIPATVQNPDEVRRPRTQRISMVLGPTRKLYDDLNIALERKDRPVSLGSADLAAVVVTLLPLVDSNNTATMADTDESA